MKLTIKITKEVLEKTKLCGRIAALGDIVQNCAIAYAVREVFPEAQVGQRNIHLWSDSILLPTEARNFIAEFDAKGPNARIRMPELQFTINVPDSVIESIGIDQAHEIIAKSSTLELA